MSSASKNILQAYYDALNGEISVDVYKVNAPMNESGNYVVIYVEGGTDASNKKYKAENTVVVVDVVTKFHNSIDPDVADDIDEEIEQILLPTQGARLLASNIQNLNLKRESYNYLTESDGKTYRKVSRWTQRINHS